MPESCSDLGAEGQVERLRDENERLRRERDEAQAAHGRVVRNESNHYDRYWQPPEGPLTEGFLDATEAKMREALTDVFCDDAAAVMLQLIAEIRSLRTALSRLVFAVDDYLFWQPIKPSSTMAHKKLGERTSDARALLKEGERDA